MGFLYFDCDDYKVEWLNSHDEWLNKRKSYIGGSDAATMIGQNKFKSNVQLWQEKKGKVKPKDVTNEAIEYGKAREPLLREEFKLWMPDYRVDYVSDVILINQKKYQRFMSYSPDGLLEHDIYGKGILEIKTAKIRDSVQMAEWEDTIPQQYFIQVLHGLVVTGFDYVWVVAELRYLWNEDKKVTKKYLINRHDHEEDIENLIQMEHDQWMKYYTTNKKPPLLINI